jgi:hypothetical protein
MVLADHHRHPLSPTLFDGVVTDGSADENLAWWESSDGTQLPHQRVRVSTKKIGDTVYAMLIPV